MADCRKESETIFRAYDVRGIYGSDLSESVAYRLGSSFGKFCGQRGTVLVGQDVRPSSESLVNSLIEGMLSAGVNVSHIGIVPSPVLYHSTRNLGARAGVMTTASHLPPEWNGFKFCDNNGLVVSEGNGLESIKDIFNSDGEPSKKRGNKMLYSNSIDDYVSQMVDKLTIHSEFKVTVDYANSVTALVVPQILDRFLIEHVDINEELKETSPNRPSEPTVESLSQLKEEVKENGSSLGIAYDGDGDRVAFVDEFGNVHSSGNTTIPIFAKYYLSGGAGGKVVADVTCSDSVKEYIEKLGGELISVRVGHSFCAMAVKNHQALFGGQYSGHMSFPEMAYADDAIFASLRMIEVVQHMGPFSKLVKDLPKFYSTRIKEIVCNDQVKFRVIDECTRIVTQMRIFADTKDGLKIYNDDKSAWVLVRASNTSPVIRINSDGKDEDDVKEMQFLGEDIVREAMDGC